MAIDTITSFKFVLSLTAIFPCLIIITIYLIDIKTIKFSSYFKLEIILLILILSSLNFFEIFDNPSGTQKDIIAKIRQHFQIALSCLLTSFNCLCCILIKNKKKGFALSLFLSVISWIIHFYLLLFYYDIIEENHKYLINLFVSGVLFGLDFIFYALSILFLHLLSKEDIEKTKNCHTNMKRITIYFLSHIIYFGIQIFYLIMQERIKLNDINLEIIIILSLNVLSIVSLFEPKTREYWDKFIQSLKLQKVDTEESEESEDDEDQYDDDDDNLKIIADQSSLNESN
jgi:hypothetical protein